MISPEIMRVLLLITILGMAVLGVLFLRTRRLSTLSYLGWGLLVMCLPLIGPFLAVLFAPNSHLEQSFLDKERTRS